MKLHLVNPSEYRELFGLPWSTPLAEWPDENLADPGGLHRHVVRLLEIGETTYVLKELPEPLAEREYRLLRALAAEDIPTATAIGVVSDRGPDNNGEAILITRHIDFSLPYRVLLSGRGLQIPYLGDRLLDALVGLLVRLHLAGFFWGDCSLSNTLFRRDAGALVAFVIDVETGEMHPHLTEGQRMIDLMIAVENVAGGLLDLEAGGYLANGIDPLETATDVERRYHDLWTVLMAEEEFGSDDVYRIDKRLDRLHDLGFDAGEVEFTSTADGRRLRVVPRVVESGYFAPRLQALTGLVTGENQARRLLANIREFGLRQDHGASKGRVPETLVAAHWLEQVYQPAIAAVPHELSDKLEAAEVFHQILEHRWFLSERAGKDVGMAEAVSDYTAQVLQTAPAELRVVDPLTMEMPVVDGAPETPAGDEFDEDGHRGMVDEWQRSRYPPVI
jgi:hypothetical protein